MHPVHKAIIDQMRQATPLVHEINTPKYYLRPYGKPIELISEGVVYGTRKLLTTCGMKMLNMI